MCVSVNKFTVEMIIGSYSRRSVLCQAWSPLHLDARLTLLLHPEVHLRSSDSLILSLSLSHPLAAAAADGSMPSPPPTLCLMLLGYNVQALGR